MSILRRQIRSRPKLKPPGRSAQQRVLAQWRGLDTTSEETVRKSAAKSAKNLTRSVLGELQIEKRQSEVEIVKVWEHLIDPTITEHARPASFNKGTLFVNVDSNVWLDEIVRYRRHEILDRLQHAFGKERVKKISFRLG